MSRVQKVSAKVQNNRWYLLFVRVGLITFGLVYGLLGLVVLAVSWFSDLDRQSASFGTVLDGVEQGPFGNIILLISSAGLFVIALWQVIEALVGYVHLTGVRRFNRRMASAGRALIYFSVGIATLLVGLNVTWSSGLSWSEIVSHALSQKGGRWTVLIAGAVVISIGIGQMGRGFGKIFVDEFSHEPPRWVITLGMLGYAMLGLSLALVGVLFEWSAISSEPNHAGTLSTVIANIADTPLLGPGLGTIVAAGFLSFAVFCTAWSFQPLHATRQVG